MQSIRVDESGPEGDRRNMAFASRAEAEDETQRTGTDLRLIGMFDDGRIEQRGGLERIFMGEMSAQQ
jgi:hypothetical protein